MASKSVNLEPIVTYKLESMGLVKLDGDSPDGKIIASASLDKTVKLWNSTDGTLLKTLTAHSGGVRGVAFSPDRKILASGSSDRTIILWNLDKILNLDELAYACNWVRDYLQSNQELEESDRRLCDGIIFP